MQVYKNPTLPVADPFVLYHDGTYYLYGTTHTPEVAKEFANVEEGEGIRVFSSKDLRNWTLHGFCLKAGDSIAGEKWFWAPEIIYKNGKFYMAYSADEHMAIAVADSPLGPFRQQKIGFLSDRRAIDGSFFFDDDGKAYFYYARLYDGVKVFGNEVYVAPLSDTLDAIDEQNERKLFHADKEWETRDCSVTEGPFMLKHEGRYYLTYSANHTRSQEYAVGYAVADNPLGPFEKYENNPILCKNDEAVGVGHHSFFTAKDGKTLVCAYHSHHSPDEFAPRRFCLDKASFETDEKGEKVLRIHGPTAREMPLDF